jgi:hypothetical protein
MLCSRCHRYRQNLGQSGSCRIQNPLGPLCLARESFRSSFCRKGLATARGCGSLRFGIQNVDGVDCEVSAPKAFGVETSRDVNQAGSTGKYGQVSRYFFQKSKKSFDPALPARIALGNRQFLTADPAAVATFRPPQALWRRRLAEEADAPRRVRPNGGHGWRGRIEDSERIREQVADGGWRTPKGFASR